MAAKSGKPGPDPTPENRGKRVTVHLRPDELDAVLDRFNLRGLSAVAAGREIGAIMRRALRDKPLLDPAREKAAKKGSPVVAQPEHRKAQIAVRNIAGHLTQFEATARATATPKTAKEFGRVRADIRACKVTCRLLADHLAATIREPVDERPEPIRKRWVEIDEIGREFNRRQHELNKAGSSSFDAIPVRGITDRLTMMAEAEGLL